MPRRPSRAPGCWLLMCSPKREDSRGEHRRLRLGRLTTSSLGHAANCARYPISSEAGEGEGAHGEGGSTGGSRVGCHAFLVLAVRPKLSRHLFLCGEHQMSQTIEPPACTSDSHEAAMVTAAALAAAVAPDRYHSFVQQRRRRRGTRARLRSIVMQKRTLSLVSLARFILSGGKEGGFRAQ